MFWNESLESDRAGKTPREITLAQAVLTSVMSVISEILVVKTHRKKQKSKGTSENRYLNSKNLQFGWEIKSAEVEEEVG